MKVTSIEPMSICDLITLTGKDALCNIDGDFVRIMNFSAGQTIEVEKVATFKGKKFGLKPVSDNKKYKYLAFLCE